MREHRGIEGPAHRLCPRGALLRVLGQQQGLMRKAQARTGEALLEAMGTAISALSAQDARSFFEHCGYGGTVQPF
jgi:hypothetical protein